MRKSNWIYSAILLAVISFLTIGYSAFTNQLYVNDLSAHFRAEADIRITNISVGNLENDATAKYEDYGVNLILSEISLPNSNSSVTYNIDVTNFGGVEMVISEINGLPENLEYSLGDYQLNHIICDENDSCKLGITKTIPITIKYKDSSYDENNTNYNLNLEFNFEEFTYEVNYISNEKEIELTKELIDDSDSISENNGVYTINKKSTETGLYISSEQLESGKTYILSYKLQKLSGTLVNIGGHSKNATEKSFIIDGQPSKYSYHQPSLNLIDDTNEHQIEFKFEYNNDDSPETDSSSNKNIYIQVNRTSDVLEAVIANIYDIHLYEVYAEETYGYNDTVTVIAGPDSSDYIVKSWNTKSDGTGTKYNIRQEISNIINVSGTSFNLYAQWVSYVGEKVFDVMKDGAPLDNISSTYVKNSTGIDFTQPSSAENGRGVYIFSPSANDDNPIYYYRGKVNDNNITLGKYCWKIVRTTSTGGMKLLFNGLKAEDGTCNNTAGNTLLYTGKSFNPTSIGIAGAGYSYTDKTSLKMTARNDSAMVVGTIFANDVSYNEATGKYTLIGDKVLTTENFTTEKIDLLKEHHYTCLKTVDEECDNVYYFYMERGTQTFNATIKNGIKNVTSLLNIEFEGNSTNENKSSIHTTVNDWYAAEMTGYTQYLEDTIYCNDRSLYNPWNTSSTVINDNDLKMHFDTKARVAYTGKPTLNCKYKADSFTVSNTIGNGKLTYPTGLLTFDEGALAGAAFNVDSEDSYINNERVWWTMSPGFVSATGVYNGVIHTMLDHVATNYTGSGAGGVRPVISIKPNTVIQGGFGTPDKPFIIEVNE